MNHFKLQDSLRNPGQIKQESHHGRIAFINRDRGRDELVHKAEYERNIQKANLQRETQKSR